MRKFSILFVDDEPRVLKTLKALFRHDYNILTASSGQEALELLSSKKIDIVVSDQRMPTMLGSELLKKVSKLYPKTIRLLLTGFSDTSAIVDTINDGEIFRFLHKPWDNNVSPTIKLDSKVTNSVKKDQKEEVSSPTLVMSADGDLRKLVRRSCVELSSTTYGAISIAQVLKAIYSNKTIGVIIYDLSIDSSDAIAALNTIKKQRPNIVTIAFTDTYDSDTAIKLINSGQVYRYLKRSCKQKELTKHLTEAHMKHSKLISMEHSNVLHKVDDNGIKLSERFKKMLGALKIINKSAQQ